MVELFFSSGADKSNIYMHATWMGLLGPVTVPFGQEKPDLLGPMFLLGRKSQTKLDQCLKARPTWTIAPFGQEKPAILGPVFPLGRKSQTYLAQRSLWAEKARLTWTNVPFGQEMPD